jgi:threonyl-tRNA synthetase
MLVIGDKEKKSKKATLEARDKKVGLRAVDAIIKRISKEIAMRKDI